MRRMICISVVFLVASCNSIPVNRGGSGFIKDSTLSSFSGCILDSTKYYLPSKYFENGSWINSKNDSFCMNWYSANYRCFKAPILYNYYLGYDNYRLLWLRSFHQPVLISINKDENITINTKILEHNPRSLTIVYYSSGGKLLFPSNIKKLSDENLQKDGWGKIDSIVTPKYNTKVVVDKTYTLTNKNWLDFVKLIEKCHFWELTPFKRDIGLDGSEWILEGQNKNTYHYVVRWSPHDSFRDCCEFLIKLSAAKNENIY